MAHGFRDGVNRDAGKRGRLDGWDLPSISVGTARWKWGAEQVSPERIQRLVEHALAGGKALFDTAPLYGFTFSETRLGAALQGVPRENYFLSSKTGYAVRGDEIVEGSLTRDELLRSVEGSLTRLRTDYLDILHLHDPDCCLEPALEVAFPTLLELRDQGVVRAVGAGMNQWEMLAEFAHQVDVDCFLLAGRYTLLEQESRAFLDLCAQKGIALLLGGVYNTGILATGAVEGAYYNYELAPPEIMERVGRIEAVCARYGVPLRAAALQFPLSHPAARTLVVGLQSREELVEAEEGLAMQIPPALWDDLRRAGLVI